MYEEFVLLVNTVLSCFMCQHGLTSQCDQVDPSARPAMVGAVAASTMATMQPAWNAAFSIQGASARAPKYALRTPAWYSPAWPAALRSVLTGGNSNALDVIASRTYGGWMERGMNNREM